MKIRCRWNSLLGPPTISRTWSTGSRKLWPLLFHSVRNRKVMLEASDLVDVEGFDSIFGNKTHWARHRQVLDVHVGEYFRLCRTSSQRSKNRVRCVYADSVFCLFHVFSDYALLRLSLISCVDSETIKLFEQNLHSTIHENHRS